MKAALFLAAALALAGYGAPGSSAGTIPADTTGGLRTTNDILGGAPSAKMKVMLFDPPLAGMSGVQVNIGIDGLQLVTALGNAVPFVTNAKPEVVNLRDLQSHSEDFNGSAPLGTYQVKNSYVTAVGDTITAVGADAGAAPSASVILTPNQNVNLPTFVD